MGRQWIGVGAWCGIVGAAAVAACTGDAGPAGPPGVSGEAGAPGQAGTQGGAGTAGAAGQNGTAGPAGAAGQAGAAGEAGAPGPAGEAGAAGQAIVVSAGAKLGLDLAPVSLNLAGLSGDQIEAVGNGSYLVNAVADCTGCHTGSAGYLAGGVQFGGGAAPFTVTTRNLTPDATTGLKLSEAQFLSAMRTGADFHSVDDAGAPTTQLVVMPWVTFRWMSTDDLRAIYAYLKTIPAASNMIPADTKSLPPPGPDPTAYTAGDQTAPTPLPLESTPTGPDSSSPLPDPGNVLRGLAINPLKEVTPPSDPGRQTMFGRGAYLVNAAADCSGCHTNKDDAATGKIDVGAYLTGGQVFDTPPPLQKTLGTVRAASADLQGPTNGFFNKPNVQFDTFLTLITQGIHAEDVTPDSGPPMRLAFPMPWQTFHNMTLSDLQAIFVYMSEVATQYGNVSLAGTADKMIPMPAMYCDPTMPCGAGMTCSSTTTSGGECLANICASDGDCAACQKCLAVDGGAGACQALTGAALAGCEANGY